MIIGSSVLHCLHQLSAHCEFQSPRQQFVGIRASGLFQQLLLKVDNKEFLTALLVSGMGDIIISCFLHNSAIFTSNFTLMLLRKRQNATGVCLHTR